MGIEFKKALHFSLIGKQGEPINFHSIQPRSNLFLIQIPNQNIRRFVYDAFTTILSGINLTTDQEFVRDYLYIQNNLHHLTADFKFLSRNGSEVSLNYRWKRQFFIDPVYYNQRQAETVFKSLLAKPNREKSWRSSLEFSDEEVTVTNGINFIANSNKLNKPLVLLEIDKATPLSISNVLDYNGQIIILIERIENILKKLSTATLEEK